MPIAVCACPGTTNNIFSQVHQYGEVRLEHVFLLSHRQKKLTHQMVGGLEIDEPNILTVYSVNYKNFDRWFDDIFVRRLCSGLTLCNILKKFTISTQHVIGYYIVC